MPVSLRPDHLDFALRLNAALAQAGLQERAWSPLSVAGALGLRPRSGHRRRDGASLGYGHRIRPPPV
ncbi:hypothetical protein ACFQZU_12410, partial [Streptomonospora algeriensis]